MKKKRELITGKNIVLEQYPYPLSLTTEKEIMKKKKSSFVSMAIVNHQGYRAYI
jgi:hypothetical protein